MLLDAPLDTPRLSVRRFGADDVDWMVALFADPRVARYVGDGTPLSPADATLWVERSNANVQRYGYGTGVVVERASGERIGWAGVARPGDGSEEIIYGIAASRWGQGYGGELIAALVALLGRVAADVPVRATVDRANGVSVALLTRYGFALAERDHRGEAGTDLYLRRVDSTVRGS